LDNIGKEAIRDLLAKNWMTHDAMWFHHAVETQGMDAANQINKAAIRSLAPIEVLRIMELLGTHPDDVKSFEPLKHFLFTTLALIMPSSVREKWRFNAVDENKFHWAWQDGECFAFKGMQRMGYLEDYRCAVIYRIERWLHTLNIKYNMEPKIGTCIMHRTGSCTGEITITSYAD